MKLERKVGDFATAAVAAQVRLNPDGTCAQAGIGLTSVGLTPISAKKAEEALRGRRVDDGAIREAAARAAEEAEPTEDIRGTVEYKRDLVRVLAARALRKALERAGGGR
jgi:carbon-monoxide dehydrogenase medium subunit